MKKLFFLSVCFNLFIGCDHLKHHFFPRDPSNDSIKSVSSISPDSSSTPLEKPDTKNVLSVEINTGHISPDSIVRFSQTLIGTPYLYGSTDPKKGFDCSGFITYVFNHFKIQVPRSSYEFDNVGITIPLAESKKGDLILFTGTDSTERKIGHMGIVLTNDSSRVTFIHSSSGKAHGVTISPLDKYYQGRFMKVIRLKPPPNLPRRGGFYSSRPFLH